MKEFRIPKHRFRAVVHSHGVEPVHLSFFLGEGAMVHPGPERPGDILNGKDTFLPAVDASNRILMVNIDRIRMITVAASDQFPDPGEEESHEVTASIVKAELILDDETRLSGRFKYELPHSHRRLQDYLNMNFRFFMLMEDGVVQFVHRRHIARVIPMDAAEEMDCHQ